MEMVCRELNGRSGLGVAYELLEELYRQQTGKPLPRILRTERGKPYFAEGGWHFSVSHTKRRAFCVLSRRNVAVDAEELDRQIDLRLARKILSPGEKAQFDAAEDRRLALLKFWVLKEAAAKLSGEGLRGYPRDTDFSLNDPRIKITDNCLVAVMEEEYAV